MNKKLCPLMSGGSIGVPCNKICNLYNDENKKCLIQEAIEALKDVYKSLERARAMMT